MDSLRALLAPILGVGHKKTQTKAPAPARQWVGRNDPCPCGSKLKAKKCHPGRYCKG